MQRVSLKEMLYCSKSKDISKEALRTNTEVQNEVIKSDLVLPKEWKKASEMANKFYLKVICSRVNLDCVHTMPAHFENDEKFDG